MDTRFQCVLYLDGTIQRTIPLLEAVMTIGRDSGNYLVLELQPVSRKHAELRLEAGAALLTDVGSSQGTFVNGQKLLAHQPHALAAGDVVQIGPYVMLYQVVEEQPQPARQEPSEPAQPAPAEEVALPAHVASIVAEVAPAAPQREAIKLLDMVLPEASHRAAYLQYLPIIFQDNHFFNRYLLIFQSVWEPLELRQNHIGMYFDPRTAPEGFLQWLASWFDVSMDRHWPEARRRQLLAEAVDLYRKRGTRYGLARMIEVCTGLVPQVSDMLSPNEAGSQRALTFHVRIALPKGSDIDKQFVEELIRAHKPAHAAYTLEVVT